jgi:5-methylthioadenosine/S-adenosylhomocysteine deaminase
VTQPCDLLITNAHIATVDAELSVETGGVAVVDGRIAACGDIVHEWHAGETIDAGGGCVMPGLVNTHAHLAMTMFRGAADDLDLNGFLGKLLPAEGAVLSAETVRTGVAVAMAECVRAGVTSVLDMYFFAEVAHAVARSAGVRLHAGPVAIQFDGPDSRVWSRRLAWAEDWLCEAAEVGGRTESRFGGGNGAWLMPHSTYLVTEPQLRQLAAVSDRTGCRVHVHAAETKAELAQVAELHGGRTPIGVLADTGLLTSRCTLAHAVHLTDRDIELIASAGAHVAHNPASNLKLASGVARIADLLDAGVNVALGTDGSASANDLDLFVAMRLAGYVAKGTSSNATVLSAAQLVQMATINGAKLLGRDDELGSIEVGKRADLVVLNGRSPLMTPLYDLHSVIANSVSRAEVTDVVIDGKVVLRDGQLTTIDLDAVLADIRALAPRLLDLFPRSTTAP